MCKLEYFRKILKHQNPEYFNRVIICVSVIELDIMRPRKISVTITIPMNSGKLYNDICFYLTFVWGGIDVIYTSDFDVTHQFSFNI